MKGTRLDLLDKSYDVSKLLAGDAATGLTRRRYHVCLNGGCHMIVMDALILLYTTSSCVRLIQKIDVQKHVVLN
jgi:hypothetical protein